MIRLYPSGSIIDMKTFDIFDRTRCDIAYILHAYNWYENIGLADIALSAHQTGMIRRCLSGSTDKAISDQA